MTQSTARPSWVIEQVLNWRLFNCCGDEDLFPFKCRACARPLVLCDECDTLYGELNDLAARHYVNHDDVSCPRCSTHFDDNFMRSPLHRVTFDEWHAAGFDHLLVDQPIERLLELLTGSATQLADFLRRGMRSTARTRITGYRNLAESIAHSFPNARTFREQGCNLATTSTLPATMDWHSQIAESSDQVYALLGITDAIIP